MVIGIIGSMHFTEKMVEVSQELTRLGHKPVLSGFINDFVGKNNQEKERVKIEQKFNENAMKRDWERLKNVEALLIINLERHGISNYIGGNTLFELAAGYFADKKIFFYNNIPDISYYKSELQAINPIIIKGDLSKVL